MSASQFGTSERKRGAECNASAVPTVKRALEIVPAAADAATAQAINLMVVDMTRIENKRECTVNEYDAFQCEIADRTNLCWTLSSEISCVIEYDADVISEENILRMAESVSLPG